MRVREDFVLREIAGEWIVIAKGAKALQFNSTVLLNETGAFLWKRLTSGDETEDSLLRAMLDTYDVSEVTASEDVKRFLYEMRSYELIID